MPVRSTPEEATQAWREGLARSGDKIARGVDRVTRAPGQAAAAQKSAYVQGVQSMADEWARRVASVSLADWQQSVKDGIGRATAVSDLKAAKYNSRITPVFAHLQQVVARTDQMPTATLDQRISKATEFMRQMAAFKKRTGG